MAQNLQISGIVKHIAAEINGISNAGKQWRSKTIVITIPGDYSKDVAFDLKGDKIDKFGNNLNIGDNVTVDLDIDAREYNGKWFTTVTAWRVTRIM
jgi:hypothetical protein